MLPRCPDCRSIERPPLPAGLYERLKRKLLRPIEYHCFTCGQQWLWNVDTEAWSLKLEV
jgi:hypothetical protein